ncbi:MAG TPA: serine/threonine-protein kinase [Fimbriiglobus sp.]
MLRPIAVGGMSTVYLAYDKKHDRNVALKVLASELAERTEFVRRFHREAHLVRRLPHPNLVRGLDVGFDSASGKHYLVLEYVSGPSAQYLLSTRDRLPVAAVVRIGIDVCRALAHLHANRFVHRDVKPENILLDLDGSAKLCDLGLAKKLDIDGDLTAVPHGVGTPYYMPFEQSLNASLVDERSDVFALGASLYHLATGHLPFAGETPEELSRSKVADRTRMPSHVLPELPASFDRLVTKALSFDPRARYQRADEFLSALEETKLGEENIDPDLGFIASLATHSPTSNPTRPDLRPVVGPGGAFPGNSGHRTEVIQRLTSGNAKRMPSRWLRVAVLLLAVGSIALATTVSIAAAIRAVRSVNLEGKNSPALTGKPDNKAE